MVFTEMRSDELHNMFLKIESLESYIKKKCNDCAGLVKENAELKQLLAEKEKEVKQLKIDLGMYKSVNEFINRYSIEKAREVLLQTEKTKNESKIDFAIEYLKRVRVQVDFNHNSVDRLSNLNFVDKLIAELKKELG